MALDLSKMSDEDLEALSKNDYSKISDAGLNLLVASEEKKKAPVREAGAGRGFVNPPLAGAPKQNLYTESPEMMYSPEGIPINPASYGGEISGGAKTAQNIMSGIVTAPVAAGLGFGGELLRQAGAVQQLVSPKQNNLSSLIAPQPQSNWLLDKGKQINSFADQMNNPAATVGQLGSYIVPGMGAQKVVQAVGAIPSAISAVRAGTSIPNALRTVAGAAPAATTLGRAGQTAIAGAGTGYVATPGEVDERAMAAAAGAALGAAGEVVIPWAGGFIKGAYNKFKGIEPPKMYNPDLVATSKTPPPIDTLQNMTPMPQNVRAAFPNQMVMPAEGTAGQQSGAAFADYLRSVRPYLDVPNITANAMGVPIPGGALASAVSGIPSGKAINTIARWMGKPNLKAEGVPGFKSESLPEQVISGFQNAMTSRELEKLAAQRMKRGPAGMPNYNMPMPAMTPNFGTTAYQTPQYNTPTTGPAIPKIPAPVVQAPAPQKEIPRLTYNPTQPVMYGTESGVVGTNPKAVLAEDLAKKYAPQISQGAEPLKIKPIDTKYNEPTLIRSTEPHENTEVIKQALEQKIASNPDLQSFDQPYVVAKQMKQPVEAFLKDVARTTTAYGPPGTGKSVLADEWARKHPGGKIEYIDPKLSSDDASRIISANTTGQNPVLLFVDEADKLTPTQQEYVKRMLNDLPHAKMYATTNNLKKSGDIFKNADVTINVNPKLTPEERSAYALNVAKDYNVNKTPAEIEKIAQRQDLTSFRDINHAVAEGYTKKIPLSDESSFFPLPDANDMRGKIPDPLVDLINKFVRNETNKNVLIIDKSVYDKMPEFGKLLNSVEQPISTEASKLLPTTLRTSNVASPTWRLPILDATDAEKLSRLKGVIERSNSTTTPHKLIVEDKKGNLDEAIRSRGITITADDLMPSGSPSPKGGEPASKQGMAALETLTTPTPSTSGVKSISKEQETKNAEALQRVLAARSQASSSKPPSGTMGLMTDDTMGMATKPMGTRSNPFNTVEEAQAYMKQNPTSFTQEGALTKTGDVVFNRLDKPVKAKFDPRLQFDTVIKNSMGYSRDNPYEQTLIGVDTTTGSPVRAKIIKNINTQLDPGVEIYEIKNGKEVLVKTMDNNMNVIDNTKLGGYANPYPTKDAFERATTFAKLGEKPYQGTYKQGDTVVQELFDPKYNTKQTVRYEPKGNDTQITASETNNTDGRKTTTTSIIKTSNPEDVFTSRHKNDYFKSEYDDKGHMPPGATSRYTKTLTETPLKDGSVNTAEMISKVVGDTTYVQHRYGNQPVTFEVWKPNLKREGLMQREGMWENGVESSFPMGHKKNPHPLGADWDKPMPENFGDVKKANPFVKSNAPKNTMSMMVDESAPTGKMGTFENPYPTKAASDKQELFRKLSDKPNDYAYKEGDTLVQYHYDPVDKADLSGLFYKQGKDNVAKITKQSNDATSNTTFEYKVVHDSPPQSLNTLKDELAYDKYSSNIMPGQKELSKLKTYEYKASGYKRYDLEKYTGKVDENTVPVKQITQEFIPKGERILLPDGSLKRVNKDTWKYSDESKTYLDNNTVWEMETPKTTMSKDNSYQYESEPTFVVKKVNASEHPLGKDWNKPISIDYSDVKKANPFKKK
jgi:hypothetical protein